MTTPSLAEPRSWAALDDAELVTYALAGRAEAFRAIMTRHNQRLYRLARTVLNDESEAEDTVQEAYLRAFAALPRFRGDASLSTWLTRIALNEALGRKRKRRPTVELSAIEAAQQSAQIIRFPTMAMDADPESAAAQREIRALLETSIDALPEPFRVVFVMRDVEEIGVDETARLLGVKPETIKTRLHRARRLLRAALDERLASALKDTFPFAGQRCARITEAVMRKLSPPR